MSSASRLFRLTFLLGGLGLIALLVSIAVPIAMVGVSPPALAEIRSACSRSLPAGLAVGALLILLLAATGLAVAGLSGRSLARQLRAHRRFLRGLRPVGTRRVDGLDVMVTASSQPQAFCAGYLRPGIYISRGTLEKLSNAELRAVVAHERHHLRRRDPLRILLVRTLGESLFFMPVLRRSAERYNALAELAADSAAAREAGAGRLASALLAFGERGSPNVVVGIAPERVDHLLGQSPRWELPLSLVVGSLATVVALVAVMLGSSSLLSGTSLSLPMLAARSCMLLMVVLPALILIGNVLLLKRWATVRSVR
jgi:Zn-dependent protease with chaperone function